MRRIDRHRSHQSGAAMVELALLTPMLLWFSLGAVDLANVFRASQVMHNAAREGARLSTLPQNHGNTAPSLARVNAYLTVENALGCAAPPTATVKQSVVMQLPNGTHFTASQVTVQCSYSLPFLHALSVGVIPSPITLSAQATFRNFY
jgi:Flp pilus assembly protein TadG